MTKRTRKSKITSTRKADVSKRKASVAKRKASATKRKVRPHKGKASVRPSVGYDREELERLQRLWSDAAQITFDPETQALIGGMNVRLDLAKALEAAIHTAHAVIAAGKIAASHGADVLSIVEVASSAIGAATAGLAAIAEQMRDVDYIGALILSEHENGLTEQAFDKAFREFLDSASGVSFPWYSGITTARLAQAAEDLNAEGMASVLRSLEKDDFLIKEGVPANFKFKPRHFTWGVHVG